MWRRVGSAALHRFLVDYTRITLTDACNQNKKQSKEHGEQSKEQSKEHGEQSKEPSKEKVQPELVVWLCRLRKCEMLSTQAVDGLWASNRLRAKRSMCGVLLKDIFGLNAQQYEFVKSELENAAKGNSGMYQAKDSSHKFALVLKLPDEIAQDKNIIGAGTATLAALASGAVLYKKEGSHLDHSTKEEKTSGQSPQSQEDMAALLKEKDLLIRQLQERYESGYRNEDVYGAIGDMNDVRGEIILNAAVRPKVRIKLKDCKQAPNLMIVIDRQELVGDVLWTHIYSNPALMRTVRSIRIVSADGQALPADAVDEDILFAKSYLYIQADVKIDAMYINMQHQKRVQEISQSVHLHTFTIRKLDIYSEHNLNVEWFVQRSDEVRTLLRGSIDTIPDYIIAKGNTTVLYGSDFTTEKFRSDVLHHKGVVDQVQFLCIPHSTEHEQSTVLYVAVKKKQK